MAKKYSRKKSGASTIYKSKKGSNKGIKATKYSAPNSSKGRFGAIVRITEKKYFHADTMSQLRKKLGL